MWKRGIDAELVGGGLHAKAVEELHEGGEELREVKFAEFVSVEIENEVEKFSHGVSN